MQMKFALTPDDYVIAIRDYYKNTTDGTKSWHTTRTKMIIPIAVLVAIFYWLHRDWAWSVVLPSSFALLLVSFLLLFIQSPKLMLRKYRRQLMKGIYADKMKDTVYKFDERGLSTHNRQNKSFTDWKDVVILRKIKACFWLKTTGNVFFVFPEKKFESSQDFERAFDFVKSKASSTGAVAV